MSALPPFEHVVRLHGPAVLRFCAARVGPDRAEDCFQETMIAALRAYCEVREAAAIRAWLYAIASRKAIDAHRARARAPEPVADPQPAAVADELEPRDVAIWRELRVLPPKQREAVALRYVADLSHREIAEAMGTSEAAARRNVFEGLARLRSHITSAADVFTP